MRKATRTAVDIGMGIIGLAMITAIVTRPNSAQVIQAMNTSFSNSIKVAVGERAVELRDVPRVTRLLGEIDDETMTELFAGLNEADLDWVEAMLGREDI
jgi:hypothetical protein